MSVSSGNLLDCSSILTQIQSTVVIRTNVEGVETGDRGNKESCKTMTKINFFPKVSRGQVSAEVHPFMHSCLVGGSQIEKITNALKSWKELSEDTTAT